MNERVNETAPEAAPAGPADGLLPSTGSHRIAPTRRKWGKSRIASVPLACALALSLALVTLVAGCGDDEGDVSAAMAGATSSGVVASLNTITVVGEATVQSAPDEAILTLTVENDGPEPGAVLDENSKTVQQVLDRLKAEGVQDDAIRTANVSVYPIRNYDPETGKESLSGYRAQNSVTVTLDDAGTVGRVLAASVETGATNISGPTWRLTEDSAAVSEALKKAVDSARRKAQTLADAQGLELGEVVMMSEGNVDLPVVPMYAEMGRASTAEDSVAEPPISPGTLDVTATLTVSYGIKR